MKKVSGYISVRPLGCYDFEFIEINKLIEFLKYSSGTNVLDD